MPVNVQLIFDDGTSPIADLSVFHLRYEDALNQPYALTLRFTSSDPAVVPSQVLGARVVVEMRGEPWLSKVPGIVASFHQKTALAGSSVGASIYELVVRPALWLLSRRTARRIHQNVTAIGAVEATLAELGGVAGAPASRCARTLETADVIVQYDETDLHFVRRVLAEAHLVAFFDPGAEHAWVLTDNLASAATPLPTPLVFRPPTGLIPSAPHVLSLSTADGLGTAETSLRDYNFEHPQLVRSSPAGLDGQARSVPSLPNERGQRQSFQVGRFDSDHDGDDIAARELVAERSQCHVVTCTTNFAMPCGSRFLLLDHPRTDLGTDFVVIASTITLDDGSSAGGGEGRRYESTCIPAAQPHHVPILSRPRIPASESAFVVGDGPEGTVEVDAYGRVKIEFPWDRRDLRSGNPTRWVRVSQAWAGSNLGIVTLPRIGDEVLVSYLGGDPISPSSRGACTTR